MFERFTDYARRSVKLAIDTAYNLNAAEVVPEHLLLALHQNYDSTAYRVLIQAVPDQSVWDNVVSGSTNGDERRPIGHIPFSLAAKKVLELTLNEGLKLEHPYIGSEHLLLALTTDELAEVYPELMTVLFALGLDRVRLRSQVLNLLERYKNARTAQLGRPPVPPVPPRLTPDVARQLLAWFANANANLMVQSPPPELAAWIDRLQAYAVAIDPAETPA